MGRALNKFGEVMLAPIESTLIQRELARLLEYLDDIEDMAEWRKVESMMKDPIIADRIFEPFRPCHPQSIRLLAHEVIHVLMIRGRFNLPIPDPRLHFSTENEYQRYLSEHRDYLLALYPKSVVEELLPTSNEESTFRTELQLHLLRLQVKSSNSLTPSVNQTSHAIIRLAIIKGALDTASRPRGTSVVRHTLTLFSLREPRNIQELENFIRRFRFCLTQVVEQVGSTMEHMLESHRHFMLDRLVISRGPGDHSTLACIHNIGRVYRKQQRFDEAEILLDRALKGREKVLDLDHKPTLDCIHELGLIYFERRRSDEAEVMLDRALKGYERALGPDHKSTLLCTHNLAVIYYSQHRLDEAAMMLDRALKGHGEVLGPDHRSTLDCIHSLVLVYRRQHRFDEAETMLDRVERLRHAVLRRDH